MNKEILDAKNAYIAAKEEARIAQIRYHTMLVEACPVKIGDTITSAKGVSTKITHVSVDQYDTLIFRGTHQRKDGSFGIREYDLYRWEYPAILEVLKAIS